MRSKRFVIRSIAICEDSCYNRSMPGTLHVLAGIPGSGKTTWAKTMLPSAAYVSSDDIRAELSNVNDQSINDQVFDIFHNRIGDYLKIGGTVVADSTALTSRARASLRAVACLYDASKHLIYFSNLGVAVVRNQARERVVPAEAMVRMLDNYERFRLSLPAETQHWDSITEIGAFSS